jgi:HSP20 family protein
MVNGLIPWGMNQQPLQTWRREMDSLFNRFFGDELDRWEPLEMFQPTADVAELDNSYEISVDLPGIQPDDVNVEWENGQLWISGQRKDEREEQGKSYHRVERRFGQFRRGIHLPHLIQEEGIQATVKDGVLRVHVPKSEQARPKRIPVNTNS